MILLVDIGNSRIKWAWLVDGALQQAGVLLHGGAVPRDLAANLFAGGRRARRTLLASVAGPELTASVLSLLGGDGPAPQRVETAASFGTLRNGYSNPAQMGVDRWLALIGARERCRGAFCVVDAGTALTLDVVDAQGEHLGGYILPGAQLMQDSLAGGTGRIAASARLQGGGAAAGHWGRDTATCLRLGAEKALACLVEDSLKNLVNQGHERPALFLTGGAGTALATTLRAPAELRPLLVLEGLAAVARGAPA
ncbi:MAG: type III pantothenate kinase [Gammaproteobacteria bacterium]|nr:type III pantothenate kinase [Gammaproteobacteria bacterium]